jgi:hypothetical protein
MLIYYYRIPNSPAGLSICLFLVLFHRTRSLYVYLALYANLQNTNTTQSTSSLDPFFGSLIGFIGIAYVVLDFVPSIEPPQNMREADGGWGAEQV